ncbi:YfmQ family protein [Neobacillus terrae]|uniref:YfmQ family protein n=1 Tax=Neobacillus terrae TaxID=3034837 RepID=UPI0014076965|nr:YfmQ family protein [Neobacillus terrae]NHM30883.1 hypothetical protein [Neobacillus terrae]
MTWVVVLSLVLISLVKIVMTCLPTGVVEWLISKFKLHAELNEANAIISINGKPLAVEDKKQVINYFNEATFLQRYYIWPGNEETYLHPENGITPLVIDTKRGKMDVRLLVFSYADHIDVVKQYKKKVIAYSVLSDGLQKGAMSS